uniref:Uncharacterized protein n=1 Tax=Nelumbo nucifera TaxID=4432 RepID=A0A822ZYT4_NELNU|nr:TPA_asm: hypothetical protein HUJ06_018462 [Nelumbo nucifera]
MEEVVGEDVRISKIMGLFFLGGEEFAKVFLKNYFHISTFIKCKTTKRHSSAENEKYDNT